jgi:RNA polymerase sigma-70 factor, ECF subfamily
VLRRGRDGRRWVRLPLSAGKFEVIPPPATVPRSHSQEPAQAGSSPAPPGAPVSEQLWHAVHERLTAFVARRVDDPADVADLVQTVFLRAHEHAAGVADQERLLPWLFQVTRNAIADHYRSPSRRREVPALDADGADELGAAPDAEDPAALAELATCVRPMLRQLPPKYRDALARVEFDGVPQVQVAAELGISVSGVKSRVQRGRAMLRDVLLACCEISRSATGGVLDFSQRPEGGCGGDDASGARCAKQEPGVRLPVRPARPARSAGGP